MSNLDIKETGINKEELSDEIESNNYLFVELQDIIDNILKRARKNAENIRDKAKKEGYKEGFELGREEGYKAGFEKGYREGVESFSDKLKYLEKLGEEILLERHRLFEEYSYEISQMALEIARRFVFTEILNNSEIVLNIIKNAISLIREKESLKIIVNPSIFGLISNTDSLSLERNKVEIIPDETLSEGDIIVISPGGRVEYRLKERFKEIEESFKDVFYSIIQSGKV